MTSTIAIERPLSTDWASCADRICKDGEREFNAFHRYHTDHRALFAFAGKGQTTNDAIGILLFRIEQEEDSGRTLFIDILCVMSSQREHGVGGALLERAYRLAADENCLWVKACIRPFNGPMVRLVERCGFEADPVVAWRPVLESRTYDDDFG